MSLSSERSYSRLSCLGVIAARGGSKRIPLKNIVNLGGRPLIAYTIEASAKSRLLSRTIVSTDDEAIASLAASYGAEVPFLRPSSIAGDDSAALPLLQHALSHLEATDESYDAIALLQPTSPFRTHEHIDAAIERFAAWGADTLTAVRMPKDHPYYFWKNEGGLLQPFFTLGHQLFARQQLPPAFVETGAMYITRSDLVRQGKFYGQRIVPYVLEGAPAVDIDTFEDLQWAEYLIGNPDRMA